MNGKEQQITEANEEIKKGISEDKLIDTVAAQVLDKYRRAFEELAK